MNKEYLLDVIVICTLTGVLVLCYTMGWLEKYIQFSLVPMLVIYYIGKSVGSKFSEKR